MTDVYRRCASVVLLRTSSVCAPSGCGDIHQILLLRKPRKRDAWQLPQGGVEEGETFEQAAVRELKEEAGVSAKAIGRSELFYQYDFPASYRRFRPDNVCGQHVKFIFVVQEGDDPVQVDNHEITEYAWVFPEQLHLYLKRKQYLGLVRDLFKEGIKLLPVQSRSR